MNTIYPSKIDIWLAVLLFVGMAMSANAAYKIFTASTSASWVAAVPILLVGIGLPLWLLCGTRYELGSERLLIRCGPFKWVVPINTITSITPTFNPLSSPALSLDRLQIRYDNGASVMISPKNKEQFLQELEALRGKSS